MSSLLYLALSNAVLATLLAVLAAVVARFCRRSAVRHALWLLVLLKLITPPLLPISLTWPRSEESESPPAVALLSESTQPIGSATVMERPDAPLPDDRGSETIGTATVREWPDAPLPDGRGSVVRLAPTAIWLGGALAWWTVAATRLWRFRRLLRQAQPAAAEVQEQGRRMTALLGLQRCPPIVLVSAPLSPMLWALGFSPRLLVPAELWRKLTAEQQGTLLVHELAHLRHGDHWVRRLELLVLGLYWWHPEVWWARRRLQEAEEECCDALVVAVLPDAASAYASALVETVSFLSQFRSAPLVGASGAGQIPLLKRRLTMILSETSSRKPSRIGFWIVLGLGALLLPLAPQVARTQAPERPKSGETKVQPAGKYSGSYSVVSRTAENAQDKPRVASVANRSEEIENQQDAIELLKVQVRLKEARINATKKTLKEYERRVKIYIEINRKQPGTIPVDTIMEVQLAATNHEGQLQVNEAELRESQVRLKQAERRLTRFQRPAEKTDGDGRAQQEKRLRELEQKVDDLLKEIHKLRKEMRPDKPSLPRPATSSS